MKLRKRQKKSTTSAVAPFVGAWIETALSSAMDTANRVAPFVGAWIETVILSMTMLIMSRVAPFVGAWIETAQCLHRIHCPVSSHPSWVRGLKLEFALTQLCHLSVAPFVGAWIET